MVHSVISYLADQRVLKIVRGLLTSARPRHLRDLATQYGLSPAGVSDILRRLQEAGLLREQTQGNRRCFSLCITDQERECLTNFFRIHEMNSVRERSPRFSKHAADKLAGMDEMYSFYKRVKNR